MDAMRRGEGFAKHSGTFQQTDRATPVLPFTIFEFLDRFGKMRMDKEIFRARKVRTALEQFLAHRVNGMRGERKAHAFRFARMRRQEIEIAFNLLCCHERFRKSHAHSRTDSHFVYNLDCLFAVPVHVRKEHRPGLDHLQDGKTAGNLDIVTAELSLERPDVFL